MARTGRKDRGLLSKSDSTGKPVWSVRLWHEGRERRFGSFKTKTDARDFYEKAKQEQKAGQFFPERFQVRHRVKPVLFKDYVDTYLANQPVKGKKPSTIMTYRGRIRKRLLPVFGSLPLTAIDRPLIKGWVAKLLQEGLDYDTTLGYLLTLSGILTEAVEDNLIPVNPALHAGKLLKRPKSLEEGGLEMFTPEEEQAFLQTVKQHRTTFYPMALTFFRTGMRAGEVMGLHREDLDFRARSIHVRRNWTRWRLTTPKNGKARKVDMSQGLADALTAWIELQDLEAAATGQPHPEILFPGNVGGTRLVRSYVSENWLRYRLWFPLIEKAGVRRLDLHAARHTFASRLIANGENLKYIAEQLGHSSIKVTADTYGHLIPGGNKQAVDRLDGVFKGGILEPNRDLNRDGPLPVEAKSLVL